MEIQDYINILDEDILKQNIQFASLFILNFECLKSYMVTQMQSFFGDGVSLKKDEDFRTPEYNEALKRFGGKNKNPLTAAVNWFKELGAISEEDKQLFSQARNKRNYITHEFGNALMQGFTNEDVDLFQKMVFLYMKIDKWWINEMEIPISGEFDLLDYDSDGVIGGQAMMLSMINDVVLGRADAYKVLLETFRNYSEMSIN